MSRILSSSRFRYLIVGGSVYLLELGVIIVAQKLGASSILAVALSFWVGLIVSFLLQKFFSFGDSRIHHKVLLSQILMVSALVAFNFTFTILATAALKNVLPALIVRTLCIAITTLWNFYLYKAHIFKVPVVD
jgi:putative flippase GtrA